MSCCSSLAGENMVDIVIQNDANTCSEGDKQWLKSLFDQEHTVHTESPYKLRRIHPLLRENEADISKCYDPLVVSIGPYHHGKPNLQFMEKFKNTAAYQYADKNQQKLEEIYTKVMHVAKRAREFYTDDDEGTIKKFSDEEFIRMMFLDGCFVLQSIDSIDVLKIKDNIAACVQRDVCLLENQLPFKVLEELMKLRFDANGWQNKFSAFIEKIVGPPLRDSQYNKQIIKSESEHLLDVLRTQLIGPSKQNPSQPTTGSRASYRSAKELKAVGIHFGPCNSRKLTDVTFTSMFCVAKLKLPQITVDDSTKSILLNMVAYEASEDGPRDFSVASYICLLDSLIDHAEDVKELRSKGILHNFLGSDQQVADLFNQIADNLVPNQNAYADVKHEIEKHYQSRIRTWLAEWLHTHFTSPWTILAFIGAIIALFLSVIQTYEAVFPKGK